METKEVWVAWSNSDLTEGRGRGFALYVCEQQETAIRLGAGKYVQGTNCPVEKVTAVKLDGQWLVPGEIIRESKEDKKARLAREKKERALENAEKAGLSKEDLEALR